MLARRLPKSLTKAEPDTHTHTPRFEQKNGNLDRRGVVYFQGRSMQRECSCGLRQLDYIGTKKKKKK
jgi:hypothetical protein